MVVTASPNQLARDWAKGYTSQPTEYSYTIENIDGQIPVDLKGTLFRNGPGLFEIGGQPIGHPFDADGMICAFTFESGKVQFKNRYVRTEGYLKEQEAKKILYRGFGTQKSGGWLANFLNTNFKNAANTNVIYWGNKLWAMWEGGHPHQLNPQTLTIWELNQQGGLIQSSSYPLEGFSILHDFLVTPRYYIFIKHPFQLNPLTWMLGLKSLEQCLKFDEQGKTKILVISRQKKEMTVLETEAFFGFHHGNAWEKEDKIQLTTICSDSFPQRKREKMELDKITFDDPIFGQFYQLTLDLSTQQVTHQPLLERSCDFPSVHPAWVGQENRYLYLSVSQEQTNNAPTQAIMKYDQLTGNYQQWNPGERAFAGEAVFVPKEGALEEDNGYLLSVVYDASLHRSYLVILDAKDLSLPLAKCHLTHHLPQGFHGTWTETVF